VSAEGGLARLGRPLDEAMQQAPRLSSGFDVQEGSYFCGCSGKFWIPGKP
jgi:hypothetical protein